MVAGQYKLIIGGGGLPNDWYHDDLPYKGKQGSHRLVTVKLFFSTRTTSYSIRWHASSMVSSSSSPSSSSVENT